MIRSFLITAFLMFLAACTGQTDAKPDCTNTAEMLAGDFNADRIPDFVMFSGCPGDYKLAVTFSGETPVTVNVDLKGLSQVKELTVEVVSPGKYKSACARGYGAPCGENDISELALDKSGILLAVPEVSSILFYWDGTQFQRLHLTD